MGGRETFPKSDCDFVKPGFYRMGTQGKITCGKGFKRCPEHVDIESKAVCERNLKAEGWSRSQNNPRFGGCGPTGAGPSRFKAGKVGEYASTRNCGDWSDKKQEFWRDYKRGFHQE